MSQALNRNRKTETRSHVQKTPKKKVRPSRCARSTVQGKISLIATLFEPVDFPTRISLL